MRSKFALSTAAVPLAMSAAMRALNCSGLVGRGSLPSARNRSMTAGSLSSARDLGVEPAHDRRRKAGRRDQSLPGHDDMSGHAGLGDGRDIGLATKKNPPAFASGEETLIEMAEFRIAPPPR